MTKMPSIVAAIFIVAACGTLSAETRTVYLPSEKSETFTVPSSTASTKETTLTFQVPSPVPLVPVLACQLLVTPYDIGVGNPQGQTVQILWQNTQISAYTAKEKSQPYTAKLPKERCVNDQTFTLKTDSPNTFRSYYGGGAKVLANRPRLIVTYDTPVPPHSGNLTDWKYYSPNSFFKSAPTQTNVVIESSNPEAIAPDGSRYVMSDGSVMALNSQWYPVWQNSLKLTASSPIALSENGQHAYLLAEIPITGTVNRQFELLCLDTATGSTLSSYQISYGNGGTYPILAELFKPVVVTKTIGASNVDYVLLAANTNDMGVLQMLAFESDKKPNLIWSFEDKQKIAVAPVPSADGNQVFVAWTTEVVRYPWFCTNPDGACLESNLVKTSLGKTDKEISNLLVDGSGSVVYVVADSTLYMYPKPDDRFQPIKLVGPITLKFTDQGTLIGYKPQRVYDFSPKTTGSISPTELVTNTIYSADIITAPTIPKVKSGDRVILKANQIMFQPGFTWPAGATLVVSIPKL